MALLCRRECTWKCGDQPFPTQRRRWREKCPTKRTERLCHCEWILRCTLVCRGGRDFVITERAPSFTIRCTWNLMKSISRRTSQGNPRKKPLSRQNQNQKRHRWPRHLSSRRLSGICRRSRLRQADLARLGKSGPPGVERKTQCRSRSEARTATDRSAPRRSRQRRIRTAIAASLHRRPVGQRRRQPPHRPRRRPWRPQPPPQCE